MSEYSFIIPGEPRGKGRPRFVTYGKIVRAYTPRETEQYEKKYGWHIKAHCLRGRLP